MKNENASLSAPWYTHVKKLKSFFAADEDVEVFDEKEDTGSYSVSVLVSNRAKYEAINKLLKKSVDFGKVSLTVNVKDVSDEESAFDTVRTAFAYNGLVKDTEVIADSAGMERTYIILQPEIMQFFNDDLSDYRGNYSSLASDVAQDLFDLPAGTFFCTADKKENFFEKMADRF